MAFGTAARISVLHARRSGGFGNKGYVKSIRGKAPSVGNKAKSKGMTTALANPKSSLYPGQMARIIGLNAAKDKKNKNKYPEYTVTGGINTYPMSLGNNGLFGSTGKSVSASKSDYFDYLKYLADTNTAVNMYMNQANNNFAASQAELQRDWSEQMSATAHQREVKDLQAAGLNPILSAGGSGAAVAAGASAGASNFAGADSSAISAMAGIIEAALGSSATTTAAALNANAAMYGADKNYAGTVYSSDTKLEGTKYSADVGYKGKKDTTFYGLVNQKAKHVDNIMKWFKKNKKQISQALGVNRLK